MNSVYTSFLDILKCALKGEKMTSTPVLSPDEWEQLIRLSQLHHVLPLLFETLHGLSEFQNLPFYASLRGQIRSQVLVQVQKTAEFQILYKCFSDTDLHPLVVKGLVCRNLYPYPDHRISSDEDLLIMPDQTEAYHQILSQFGLSAPETSSQQDYEIPYKKDGSPLYIELHRYLFPPQSEAYGDLNRFFDDVYNRSVKETIQGITIHTLAPTDHLFYLICHSFKHFLHSGFGIRQVCDIILYANAYGSQIDWHLLLENCRLIRADYFAAALFSIGKKHLVFDPVSSCYPAEWRGIKVDETNLLHDLLLGGVFGSADMNRRRSSNITLDAVSAQKQGKKSKNSLLLSLFPSAKKIEGRFPYLRKRPYLLPIAWAQRMIAYGKENHSSSAHKGNESLKIGTQRVNLLKEYHIID